MCYACEAQAAEEMGRNRRFTMSPSECAEGGGFRREERNAMTPTTPGTSIHRLLEEYLRPPPGVPTNEEMDRMELEERERNRDRDHRGPRPGRTIVVIARDARTMAEYCHERGWDPAGRGVVLVRAGDVMAERSLMGRRGMEIHRVEGAAAHPNVERMIRHLVARGDATQMVNTEDSRWADPRGYSAYHAVVNADGVIMTPDEVRRADREEAFRRFYGSQPINWVPDADNPRMNVTGQTTIHFVPETQRARRQTGEGIIPETYVPHGEIETEPQDETAWVEPAHWASTLERSPFWYRAEQVLRTDAGDYRADELDLDIRYV